MKKNTIDKKQIRILFSKRKKLVESFNFPLFKPVSELLFFIYFGGGVIEKAGGKLNQINLLGFLAHKQVI